MENKGTHSKATATRPAPAIITAGAQLSNELIEKIKIIENSKPRLMKHEKRVVFADDFSWPEYDKWKEEFERIGYQSAVWGKMEKWEILLLTIDNIKNSYEQLNQETRLEDLRWELLVDDDCCPSCQKYKGKIFTKEEVPIPGQDTHPGCRCCLMPVVS